MKNQRLHPDEDPSAELAPRRFPRQSRSNSTVEAIVEAAARLLERDGMGSCTTNAIAQVAGVSIGSLYQYFPNRDAIIRALIEREGKARGAKARSALLVGDVQQALGGLVAVAVNHQLDRPHLSLLLESEELRLNQFIDLSSEVDEVTGALITALRKTLAPGVAITVAEDAMTVIRVLTDAAGARRAGARQTIEVINGAVCGLVAAAAAAMDQRP